MIRDGLGPMLTAASPTINARLDVRPQSNPTAPGIWALVVSVLTGVSIAFATGQVVLPIPWLGPVIGLVLGGVATGLGTWAGVKSAGAAKVTKLEQDDAERK